MDSGAKGFGDTSQIHKVVARTRKPDESCLPLEFCLKVRCSALWIDRNGGEMKVKQRFLMVFKA